MIRVVLYTVAVPGFRLEKRRLDSWNLHPARWTEHGSYAGIELRADSHDNIWVCEMGDERAFASFERFVEAVAAAPVACDGLRVRYRSPSLGEVAFGWIEALSVGGEEIALHGYPRFDTPYCRAEVGGHHYSVALGAALLTLDLSRRHLSKLL